VDWSRDYIRRLVMGTRPVEQADGSWDFEEASGWYEMKHAAYDSGDPNIALDAFQLDGLIDRIPVLSVRAAVNLKAFGWDTADIGAVLRSYKHLPASKMVRLGVDYMWREYQGAE
jgi:hypothetical protein